MDDLERRLATTLLDHTDVMRNQATRIRNDRHLIDYLQSEIGKLKRVNSKQLKAIQLLTKKIDEQGKTQKLN
jgi:hypothetical protein